MPITGRGMSHSTGWLHGIPDRPTVSERPRSRYNKSLPNHTSSPKHVIMANSEGNESLLDEDGVQIPWQLSTYHTKKKFRRMDSMGNFQLSPADFCEPVGWKEGRWTVALQVLSEEMSVPVQKLQQGIPEVMNLLPGLSEELERAGCKVQVADVVRLAADPSLLSSKLLRLREILPDCNVDVLATYNLALIQKNDCEGLEVAVNKLRSQLPGSGLRTVLMELPVLLDPECFESTIAELTRLLGDNPPPVARLASNPSIAHLCSSLQGQSRGDRNDDYLQEIYKGTT